MRTASTNLQEIFFFASMQEDPLARSVYLDETCGRDTDLRRHVEGLLSVAPKVSQFLESPAVSPVNGLEIPACHEHLGKAIGPYELTEVIGEGGMGVVYKAEQQRPVKRTAALKIIKPGMDTKQVIARFEIERQALAMMEHPSIAKVFDAGTTDSGRSYFVMELVRGTPITEYCDSERLSISDRLKLFILVCQAVQHAHQKGIIHRDLKPSNILVTLQDGAPVPKIIDFGIAKAFGQSLTDKTLFTGYAQLIGTPRYMSPEQAEMGGLDIDTRSDIFSLGALLYELLTGSTPFDEQTLRNAGFDEVRRIIREDEPPRPSTRLSRLGTKLASVSAQRGSDPHKLVGSVRGELDWIVMMCLEKDRDRRYDTANSLVRDLTNCLDDKPVEACPPSRWYQFAKFTRRNQAILITAALVSLALISGTAVSILQAVRAMKAEGNAERAQADSERHRRAAERHLFVIRLRVAIQAFDAGEVERAQALLRVIESNPDGLPEREFAWRYLRDLIGHALRSVGRVGEAGSLAEPSPDGRFLASYNEGGPIHLIDLATMRHLATLRTPAPIQSQLDTHFSPDGGRIAATEATTVPGAAQRSWIWEVPTGRLLLEVRPPLGRTMRWVTLVAGGRFISENDALKGASLRADLWDISRDALKPLQIATLSDGYSWGERSADGELFATAEPNRIVIHDVLTGTVRRSLGKATQHRMDWRPVFSIDKQTLVAISTTRAEFWDLSSGKLVASRKLDDSTGGVWCSPDGVTLCLCKRDGALEVWNRQTDRTLTLRPDSLVGPHELEGRFSADGLSLVAMNRVADREWARLKIWDVTTGSLKATCPIATTAAQYRNLEAPDGRHLILAKNPVAQIWRIEPPAPLPLAGHTDEAWAVAFSRNGDLIATGSDDTDDRQTIKLWESKSGKLKLGWYGETGTVSSLAFAPDGQVLASAHLNDAGSVRLWDVASGNLLGTLDGHTKPARSVAFHPSGRWLASCGSDGTARIWDVAERRCIQVLEGHEKTIQEVAFSPDGNTLATAGSDMTVRLWEVATGRLRQVLEGGEFMSVAFSPDGTVLAAPDVTGQVWLWDTDSFKSRGILQCDQGILNAMAFAPGGEALAVAGKSGRIVLWDVATNQEMIVLQRQGPQVNGLSFSPDGQTIAACSHDGSVKLWRSEEQPSSP
jgi:eukaryotic-like serine/threonine-protein kinase